MLLAVTDDSTQFSYKNIVVSCEFPLAIHNLDQTHTDCLQRESTTRYLHRISTKYLPRLIQFVSQSKYFALKSRFPVVFGVFSIRDSVTPSRFEYIHRDSDITNIPNAPSSRG